MSGHSDVIGAREARPCKCCGGAAAWFGAVDFAKACAPTSLPAAGWSVAYHRCGACGFLFSTLLDDWSHDRLRRDLYNDDYVLVDPEVVEVRPERVADLVDRLFGGAKPDTRVFDYGGGSGVLARKLAARGFAEVAGADPFFGSTEAPPRFIDLMVCVEVVEHLTVPDAAFAAAGAALNPDGALFFTTLLQPADIARQGAGWWYLAPRNGHVSLHTAASLRLLCARHGLAFASINETLHLAWRGMPRCAAPIIAKLAPQPA